MTGQAHDADPTLAAVVLAGGRASRLDGADKAGVELGGRTLLSWALDAVVAAAEVVVVGDAVTTDRPVTFTRESPRFGGPVAALLTGVDALRHAAASVVVLAVDMPHVSGATVDRLRAAAGGHDGSVLLDPDGRRQLALVLDAGALARVRPDRAGQQDLALHRLLAGLDLAGVRAEAREHRDVDTWQDLRELRDLEELREPGP